MAYGSAVDTAQRRRRRAGPVVLVIGVAVLVIIAIVGTLAIRWMSQPDSSNYATVRDSAGQAKGAAGQLTEALRARGLACSDQYLNDRIGFSRGCYRTDFKHDVEVEFAGPADGLLGRISISVDYIGAGDEKKAHGDFDALVAEVVRSAALSPADAATMSKRLAAGTDQKFTIGWGSADLTRGTEATSSIRLRRTGWTTPAPPPTGLPGSIKTLVRSAVQRGYSCPDAGHLDCSKKADGVELRLMATRDLDPANVGRLYVSAKTGRKDQAMTLALAEQAAVLDALGVPRATEVKSWFAANSAVAGGRAYVSGMRAHLKVVDLRGFHYVQLDLNAPPAA